MNAAELKAIQAPLKEVYREDASRALITLKAKGSIDDQSIACKVETGGRSRSPGCIPEPAGRGSNSAPATCCSKLWSRALA